jgi:two-component system response regulator GlrR
MEADDSQDVSKLLEMGVDDFVISSIKPGEILLRIRRLLEKNALEDLVSQSIKQKFGLKQIIGESASFLSEIKKIPVLAKSDAIVLITGETGTGKELCARAIHYLSPRGPSPFMPINCGAIPADLVENELFGHEKGAFTGASESRTGLIAEAVNELIHKGFLLQRQGNDRTKYYQVNRERLPEISALIEKG